MSFFSRKKEVSINKTVFFNILSVVLLQGISFLSAPIFTRMLGANQYGDYGMFNAWTAVLSSFMGLSVGSAIGTGMYEFKEDYLRYRNSVYLLGVLVSGIITFVIIVFKGIICQIIHYPEWMVVLMPVYSMSGFMIGYVQTSLVYEKRPNINFFISLLISLSTVIVSLVLVTCFPVNERYIGRIIGASVPQILIAFIAGIFFFLKKPAGYNKRYWNFAIALGLPIVFHILSQRILTQSDRIMMEQLAIGKAEIGIYTVFYSFASVLNIILSALNTSWAPFYYGYLDEEDDAKLNSKSKNYIELMTVLSCGFVLLSKEVGRIYAGEEYYSGIGVIPLLVLSVYFTFMYQFPVNFEMFHKKTNSVAVGTVMAATANVIMNALLIPPYGMYGAAVATAISYALLFMFHYINVKYCMKEVFHLDLARFCLPICVLILCIVLFYLIDSMWYIRWIIGALIGLFELVRVYKRRSIF